MAKPSQQYGEILRRTPVFRSCPERVLHIALFQVDQVAFDTMTVEIPAKKNVWKLNSWSFYGVQSCWKERKSGY